MIDRTHDLPVTRQCRILDLSLSTAYYVAQPTSAGDMALMHRIDKLHLEYPFAGPPSPHSLLRVAANLSVRIFDTPKPCHAALVPRSRRSHRN